MSKSLGNVISPFDIIKDYGADILRLWVCASDYNEDIRISKEILTRLSEAYRKIRNTAKFILSNLYDFNPETDKLNYAELGKIDKWILFRLERVAEVTSQAYEKFEFYKAYKTIYDFCNGELSMGYLDMVKGRLYTSASDARERRAAQTAIYEIINYLARLIAPIFVFTAEEIYAYIPKDKKDRLEESVHLLEWPSRNPVYAQVDLAAQGKDIDTELGPILGLIPEVAKMLESKRGEAEIGSSFEAKIILLTNDEFRYKYLESLKELLPEVFKVSQVEIKKTEAITEGRISNLYQDIAIVAGKAQGNKCVRCWNYSNQVGQSKTHPLICERCLKAIKEE